MSEHVSCISVIAVDRNASVCGEIVHRGGGEVYQCREAAGVYYGTRLKGLVHFQIKMSWYFTHPHVIQDVYVFLSSVAKKLRFLMKTF